MWLPYECRSLVAEVQLKMNTPHPSAAATPVKNFSPDGVSGHDEESSELRASYEKLIVQVALLYNAVIF